MDHALPLHALLNGPYCNCTALYYICTAIVLHLCSGTFLMASCRWNQTAAPDEALARLSEVVDWEEGGRTQPHHVSRIFEKEKEDGERRVLVVMRRVRERLRVMRAGLSKCPNRGLEKYPHR